VGADRRQSEKFFASADDEKALTNEMVVHPIDGEAIYRSGID